MNKLIIGLIIASILLVGIGTAVIYEEMSDEEFDTLLENYTEDVHGWTEEDDRLLNDSAEALLSAQIAEEMEVNYDEFMDETDKLIGELEAELSPTIEEVYFGEDYLRGGKYG